MSLDHDPFEVVRARLADTRPERGGLVARCPAHDDSKPSLRLSRGDDGRALLCCRAGCSTEEVVQALGLAMRDLMPREPTAWQPTPQRRSAARQPQGNGFATVEEAVAQYQQKLGEESARWTYTDPSGEPVAVVLRWNHDDGTKRDIRPVARIGGRWHLQAPDGDRCLYRLGDLGGGGPVLVAEGEKATDALASLGFNATTSMGGAKAAAKSSWASLAGREVFILPDEDKAGLQYADEVRAICEGLAPPARVFTLRLHGLEPDSGEDAVEWITRIFEGDQERARRALEALMAEARKPKMPSGGRTLAELALDPAALKPPPCISSGFDAFDAAQPWGALATGSLVVVGGEVGSGKSRFLLSLALGFARQRLRVAYLLGEMDEGQAWRRSVCGLAGLGFKALMGSSAPHQRKLEQARRELAEIDGLAFVRPGASRDALAEWAAWADILFVDPLHTLADGFERDSEAERITLLMRELVGYCADGLTVLASSEITQGNGKERGLHNAYKGSSAIKQYATALYFLDKPDGGRVQLVRCMKQREGKRVGLKARIGPGWQSLAFEKPLEGGEDE
jgi:hypothetical protein